MLFYLLLSFFYCIIHLLVMYILYLSCKWQSSNLEREVENISLFVACAVWYSL